MTIHRKKQGQWSNFSVTEKNILTSPLIKSLERKRLNFLKQSMDFTSFNRDREKALNEMVEIQNQINDEREKIKSKIPEKVMTELIRLYTKKERAKLKKSIVTDKRASMAELVNIEYSIKMEWRKVNLT